MSRSGKPGSRKGFSVLREAVEMCLTKGLTAIEAAELLFDRLDESQAASYAVSGFSHAIHGAIRHETRKNVNANLAEVRTRSLRESRDQSTRLEAQLAADLVEASAGFWAAHLVAPDGRTTQVLDLTAEEHIIMADIAENQAGSFGARARAHRTAERLMRASGARTGRDLSEKDRSRVSDPSPWPRIAV